jgi:hypothetical protein
MGVVKNNLPPLDAAAADDVVQHTGGVYVVCAWQADNYQGCGRKEEDVGPRAVEHLCAGD